MALITYEPLNILNEINALINNVFPREKNYDQSQVEMSHWLPAVDIKETKNCYILNVDLPGVDPKAIDIAMENNVLTIKGHKANIKKEERDQYYRIERTTGDFYRRFTLPDNADNENIAAKCKNGVLEIQIPKKQTNTTKRIEIESMQ